MRRIGPGKASELFHYVVLRQGIKSGPKLSNGVSALLLNQLGKKSQLFPWAALFVSRDSIAWFP